MNIGRKSSGPETTVLAGNTEPDGFVDISTLAIGFIRCASAVAVTFVGDRYLHVTQSGEIVFGAINDDAGAPISVTTIADEWVPLPAALMGFAGVIKPVIAPQGGDTTFEFALKG